VLEAPLRSEAFFDLGARVILALRQRSKPLMAAGMDHVVDGPDGTESAGESGPDVGRVTVATELKRDSALAW
jgi:alpha,alpha-trehalose phosphorylase